MTAAQSQAWMTVAKPRWATPRSPERMTFGPQVAQVARSLGWELMPHQQLVLDVGLEIDPDTGIFAYRDITVTEPRQGGKSSRLLSLAIWRATEYALDRRLQRVAYSAQSGFDARRKMLDDWLPVLEQSEVFDLLSNVRRASGHEAFQFYGGSMIEPIANTVGSGHGKVLDLALIDEAFDDSDDRREQAMVPAMATRADAQLWVTSTAGTEDAYYLRRKVETGRSLAEAGVTKGSAYFEWSAADDADLDDEETWPTFMPALGLTIPIEAVRHAHTTMTEPEFSRAFGNRWTTTKAAVIPLSYWLACRDRSIAPSGALTLAVDTTPDRSSSVIVCASNDGGPVIELIERRAGLAWVIDRLRELREKHDVRAIVVHAGGPAGTLAMELERNFGAEAVFASDSDMVVAAGMFYDNVMDGRLKVLPNEALDDAVAGARQRKRGDAFTWSRRSPATDLSPLVASSLALWRALNDGGGALWVFR